MVSIYGCREIDRVLFAGGLLFEYRVKSNRLSWVLDLFSNERHRKGLRFNIYFFIY